jgi:small-conductance mechanosensitive channel/ABC-type branched-subunit amino acid transport system substrate-binding protein
LNKSILKLLRSPRGVGLLCLAVLAALAAVLVMRFGDAFHAFAPAQANLSLKYLKETFSAEPELAPVGSERLDVVFVADFSGPSKRVGQDLAKGFEDALAERKGSDVLRVLVRDDQGRAEAVEALAEGSAAGFSTLALVGPTQPAGYQAFAAAAEQGQVPALIPVPPPVRMFDNKWLFSLQPGQVRQGEFAGKILQRIRAPRKVAFVMAADSEISGYWYGMAQSFADTKGVKLELVRLKGAPDSIYLGGEILALERFDLLFVDLPTGFAVNLLQSLKDDRYPGTIVGFGEMALPDFPKRFERLPKELAQPGHYTNGVFAWTPFTPDVSGEYSRGLADAYEARIGHEPSWAYAYGYDSGLLLADFVLDFRGKGHTLQNTAPEEWRAALRDYLAHAGKGSKPTSGFTGSLRFDKTHQRDVPPTLTVYREGRQTPYLEQYGDSPPALLETKARKEVAVVEVDGSNYELVPVVYSGLRVQSISEIDFSNLQYKAEFDLWFRSSISLEPEEIFFPEAVEGTVKGKIIESVDNPEQKYRRMRFEGHFRFESSPREVLLERVTLPLSWRHRSADSSQLRFVVDTSSYKGSSASYLIHEQVNREAAVAPALGYRATNSVIAVENRVIRSLGDPRSSSGALRFSTIGERLNLESKSGTIGPTLARAIPWQGALLGGGIMTGVWLALGLVRRFAGRLRGLLSALRVALLAVGLLLAEVAVFGSTLLESVPSNWLVVVRNSFMLGYYLAAAYIVDDLIWWLIRRGRAKSTSPLQGTMRVLLTGIIFLAVLAAYYTNVLGRDVLPVLATSSVLLTVIGLALRELILDAISGITLIIEGEPKIGEWVMVRGPGGKSIYGMVEHLGWRTVRIRSRDDQIHFVPNSTIVQHTLSNFSMRDGYTRIEIPFEVSSSANLSDLVERVAQEVTEVLVNDPGVDPNRAVRVICVNFEADSAEMAAQVFYRADASEDSLKTRVLQTVSTVLRRHDALPTMKIALGRQQRALPSL